MARRIEKKRPTSRSRAAARKPTSRRGGADAVVLAEGLRAPRGNRTARGAATFAGTYEDALHPRFMLDIPLPRRAVEHVGDVAFVESEPWPSLRAAIFATDRKWKTSGDARILEVQVQPGRIAVALPEGSSVTLNGTHPAVTCRNGPGGLALEMLRLPVEPLAFPTEILEAFKAEPWLKEMVLSLARDRGLLAPLVAVGTFTRLWVGAVPPARRRETTALLLAGRGPDAWIGRWWAEHRDAHWAEIEAAALDEVEQLARELRRPGGIPAARRATWLRRREDLACVDHATAGRSEQKLVPALATLDRLGQTHAAMFVDVKVSADPRLARVRALHPEAWWAEVGW